MHKKYFYHNNFLIDVLSTLFIIAGLFILGYVLLHLLYWLFLTVIGIAMLAIGIKFRKPYCFTRWFSRHQ